MPIQISTGVKVGTMISSGESSMEGYLLCNGSLVSRTTYSELFSVIGTTFGSGNGSTTFAIPDLVGASPRGAGTSSGYTQNITVTLGAKDNDRIQGHLHSFSNFVRYNTGTNNYGEGTNFNSQYNLTANVSDPITDNINGTPRTGNETKMKNLGVNFFIKF